VSSEPPLVDVIVAVHNERRPVERAVRSVLCSQVAMRVTVVAHNVDPRVVIGRLGTLAADERVRVLQLADGVRSPANAFNFGIDAASARYVTIIGSDDSLQTGALDAWVALAEEHRVDAVIAPVIRDDGHPVPTPRIRRGRYRALLDFDRDRVFERTAALGLQRRDAVTDLRYTEGLPRGVDQEYGIRLWSTGRIVFDPAIPAYREHADQSDRVTHAFGPLIDDFHFLDGLLEFVETLSPSLRRAVIAKLIRVHLVPAVRNRIRSSALRDDDLASAAAVLARLAAVSPDATGLLPLDCRADLDAIRSRSAAGATAAAQRRASRVRTAMPIRARWVLHRHAPLRSLAAGRAVMRAVARADGARTRPDGGDR